jgi:hypothetical protein
LHRIGAVRIERIKIVGQGECSRRHKGERIHSPVLHPAKGAREPEAVLWSCL